MPLRYEKVVEINAPAERAWEVLAEVGCWPEWTPSITAAEPLTEGALREGYRARLTVRGAGRSVWTVTEVVPGQRFTWGTALRGTRPVAWHVVEPRPGGSRATLGVEVSGLPATLLAAFLRRGVVRNVEAEAAGLKKRAEHAARAN